MSIWIILWWISGLLGCMYGITRDFDFTLGDFIPAAAIGLMGGPFCLPIFLLINHFSNNPLNINIDKVIIIKRRK